MSTGPADDLGPESLTVAMITMNEEGAIGKVIDDIRAVVPRAEVLVVDSSKDRTPEIAEQKGARVIRQFPPKGYGPAMELALRSGTGAVVVTLDCDDTYPAPMIAPMARLVLNGGYDLIDGSRLNGKPEAMPWLNYAANYGFAAIASGLFGTRVTDLHSGMRAYRRSMLDGLAFEAKGAALPVELLLVPMRAGFRVGVVNIDYRERIGVSTMQPLDSAKWTAKRIWRARTRRL
jgi:glycosyltransferase involved in cell wall biosynthesis